MSQFQQGMIKTLCATCEAVVTKADQYCPRCGRLFDNVFTTMKVVAIDHERRSVTVLAQPEGRKGLHR